MTLPPPPSATELADELGRHPVRLVGQLLDASNAAFFGRVGDLPVIYKPVAGERPLWDFPTGRLAWRERAAFLVDEAGGFGIVPPTVLADGPYGEGSVQAWVTDPEELVPTTDDEEDDAEDTGSGEADPSLDEPGEEDALEDELFVLLPPDEVGPPWLPVFTGELPDGSPVTLAHADTPVLQTVAVLDAVLNNSDRKGSHLLRAPDGHLWGIDHGVTLHEQPKLRTVLWGWAGESIRHEDLVKLEDLRGRLDEEPLISSLEDLLTVAEIDALKARVDSLLTERAHPLPQPGWPSVPWPAL